jgi:hypothetical protein
MRSSRRGHAPAAEAPGGSRKLKTALHELRALLSQCRLQQGTDSYGLRNQSVDLLDLSFGNMTPTLGRWPPLRIFQQDPDFVDPETHEFREAHDRQPFQDPSVIAPLTAHSRGPRQQSQLFIVTDRRGTQLGAPRNLADSHADHEIFSLT